MPNNTKEDRLFAQKVFISFVTDRESRLARGNRLRNEMHDSIERGEKPVGYRPQWLRDSALELVRVLRKQVDVFDADHEDDKASVSDILDILATASGLFRRSAEDQEEASQDDEEDVE